MGGAVKITVVLEKKLYEGFWRGGWEREGLPSGCQLLRCRWWSDTSWLFVYMCVFVADHADRAEKVYFYCSVVRKRARENQQEKLESMAIGTEGAGGMKRGGWSTRLYNDTSRLQMSGEIFHT